ncbi:peptidase S41 [Panacibacter ginsenosidivorans]|uniref:Tricorn protease homolog n=1 Tax=Panacibacter ginsenosidivorans TaxID=1813871 RepID=A0A5B8V5X2_9BACT|nr:S41 family peptidase [Panacibacter ginsenosidivorans]QEC66810.1 peptidase S41 [Panacibacter ginsenosidivorans]
MRKYAILCCIFFSLHAISQDTASWLRYPAISPDGQTILFCYKGDIYKVSAGGGQATPMTISEAYDFSPVWSHDGKSIAFASDRYGNFDVFIMPASGGEAKRLTYYSINDIPSSFSADDKQVIFSSLRQKMVTDVQFPDAGFGELYSVSVNGGNASQLLPIPAIDATVNAKGDKIIYHDLKGYESDWRKHHTSAVTRDIWLYDVAAKKYTMLTTNPGEDRNPVFDSDNTDYYYLSEQNGGSFNVYKSSINNPSQSVAVTNFTKNPVRFLTASKDNTLCFGYNGDIFTKTQNGEPQKLSITVAQDGRSTLEKVVPVMGNVTEMKVSPNNKEIAFVFRGEIFVTSVEGGVTKRITNTPWQERSINFSSDGKSIVYAGEKDNNWNIYKISIVRKEEPYFYASTLLKQDTVVATAAEEFQPAFSPDGKEVAYLENRVTLKVVNLASKQSRTILTADKNYSYADGDQYYQWSPDGKWFIVQFGVVRLFTPQLGLVSSDGKGQVNNISKSGYDCFNPKWVMDGKMLIYGYDRDGTRAQAGFPATYDVYALFLTKDAFDRYNLSKEDYALLKDMEDKQKDSTEETAADAKKGKATTEKKDTTKNKNIKIDWDNISDRKARLTISSADIADMVLSKNGEKLFYLAKFEKGYDLWVTELRTKDTKLFVKLGARNASMELSADGKSLFVLNNGNIVKIDPESGKMDGVSMNGEMNLNQYDEKAYMFDHMWRQMKEKFLFEDLNHVDWDYYYNNYKKFLPYINNNYDFAEMVSEMLGEMNASHTGCYYRGNRGPGLDQTAALGIFYDYTYKGNGLKIQEIIEDGPLDKATSKIKAGDIIEKIDGDAITDTVDHYKYLNRKANKFTLLSVYDPVANKRWDETVKPISLGEEFELLYKRWVNKRRKQVDSLSGGKVGYVHVRAMDDDSYRTVIEDVLGKNIEKQSIIVDTRFNGGGNIHEQLSDFLDGKKYFDVIPHGQTVGYEPYDKWIKPSIVLMGECNYSDAHLFPVAYKLKNVGKTVGMPVPGTGTFVWWEGQIDNSLVFGIPQGGWRMPDGKFCENTQLEPDIKVRNTPALSTTGRDEQIEAAVKELLK